MFALSISVSVLALTVGASPGERGPERPNPWNRIVSLMEKDTGSGNPEFEGYLKSLSAEEMLLGARQACAEVAERSNEYKDMPPAAVAEIYVMACLQSYFDKVDRSEGGRVLLEIVANRRESPYLRAALISRMWDIDEPFDDEFQAYVKGDEPKVTAILTEAVKAADEHPLVRQRSIYCLAERLTKEVGKITRADPNVHAVWERTHTVVPVGKLLRSRELTLTEQTLKELQSREVQALAYIKLFGAIVVDEKSESEEVRKQAGAALERLKALPFPALDQEIEGSMRQGD